MCVCVCVWRVDGWLPCCDTDVRDFATAHPIHPNHTHAFPPNIQEGTEAEAAEEEAIGYGVCLVDPTTGVFRVGQFADGKQRWRLRTLLSQFTPSEVRAGSFVLLMRGRLQPGASGPHDAHTHTHPQNITPPPQKKNPNVHRSSSSAARPPASSSRWSAFVRPARSWSFCAPGRSSGGPAGPSGAFWRFWGGKV